MGAQILQFKPPPQTAEEAYQRYIDLVNERHERDLWKDLEHNIRIGKAWDQWWALYSELERQP